MKRVLLLSATHAFAALIGFAAGIYTLPLLIAPPTPSTSEVTASASGARYRADFKRDLKGSDAFHWGEGSVSLGPSAITFAGRLAPGPDYKLYLVPEFVETAADFTRLKQRSLRVGDVKTFENFVVPLPANVNLDRYTTVVVWCETFSQFITSARYR
jgi:hypothetical protein